MSLDRTDGGAAVREHVLQLGANRTLVGIASEPAVPRGAPAVLLVNAGVIHRIGPHRLHVRLARRLAESGHPAVRMDVSGIGDSSGVPERLTFRASSVADIRAAVDHITAWHPDMPVVVFGICSGADNALAAAEADPRITGLILIDPPCYVTPRARFRALRARLRSPSAWLTLPVKAFARFGRRWSSRPDAAAAASGGRQPPPIDEYRRQLEQLVARGVRILSIYSAALGVRYNHADQLYEWFPELKGRLDVRYCPEANHTFTELAQQSALIGYVLDWCRQRYAARG